MIKKFSSALEIFIILIVFIVILIIVFKKYYTKKIERQIEKNSDPSSKFSRLFNIGNNNTKNKSFSSMASGYLSSNTNKLFKPIEVVFNNIFGIFTKAFKHFFKTINQIRNLTRPIRTFFKNTAMMFYKKLNNFMIGIMYSLHKMRNTLRRSVSGFNMAFHTLNHIQYSFEAIANSPIPKVAKDVEPVINFMSNTLNTFGLCFDENTIIDTKNGKISIKNIELNVELDTNNFIISKHKFIAGCDMYNYFDIIVSGSHLVQENNKWIRIEESEFSKKIDYKNKFIYCLNTTKGYININNIIFSDFSESNFTFLNKHINQIILDKLNNTSSSINTYVPKFLEQGIHGDTKLRLKTNQFRKIKDINIGDEICNGHVLGKILINSKYIDIFKYKNNYILSGNVKVNENGIWINVSDSVYSKKIRCNAKFYHIVTSSSILNLENLKICDYLECHDDLTNNLIDNFVSKYKNVIKY